MRLIDADAVKAVFEEKSSEAVCGVKLCKAIISRIDEAPTIDAVPVRHGKWEVTPVYIKCSECGESFMLIPQNYCPHCGARMDGTQRKPCDDCQQFDCYGCEYAERKEE